MILMAKTDGPIFQPGDAVRLNEPGNAKAKFRDRRGVVVGPSRIKGKFRVLWSGLKRPQIVHATLLQPADSEGPAIATQESMLAALDEALEKTRDSRFERHLNMPRERPLETDQPWSARAPRNRRFVLAGIIGMAAASIAIGAAFVLIGR
jgi:hypothetical protein